MLLGRDDLDLVQHIDTVLVSVSGHEILARGNGADRQLALYETTRDLHAVVAHIADATEATHGS